MRLQIAALDEHGGERVAVAGGDAEGSGELGRRGGFSLSPGGGDDFGGLGAELLQLRAEAVGVAGAAVSFAGLGGKVPGEGALQGALVGRLALGDELADQLVDEGPVSFGATAEAHGLAEQGGMGAADAVASESLGERLSGLLGGDQQLQLGASQHGGGCGEALGVELLVALGWRGGGGHRAASLVAARHSVTPKRT